MGQVLNENVNETLHNLRKLQSGLARDSTPGKQDVTYLADSLCGSLIETKSSSRERASGISLMEAYRSMHEMAAGKHSSSIK